MDKKISIIGAGGWGTTMACLLGEKGFKVNLWVREPELVEAINSQHENTLFLKGKKIPETVVASNSLQEVVSDADYIISAVPSSFVRAMAKQYSSLVKPGAIVVSLSKGLEHDTFKRMSEILEEELPDGTNIVALSGPNHAEEVSRKIPTATVIASKNKEVLPEVQQLLTTNYFKVYPLDDIIGVEIGGAVKNITAIATGVCAGLGLGDNSTASIITLGLAEMARIGKVMGAKPRTLLGLAGVGDLIATCTSKHSRNRFVGEHLAKGLSSEQIKEKMHAMVAEGVKTAKSVYDYSVANKIDLPLTKQVYKLLYENKDMQTAIKDLLDHVEA